ncbi:ThiF family adenylyltransferase [Pontibacter sp. 172403-2]|uniref:ThiF family adenylyltransferase n=1 Tax=Pontibacter rufus TaxID=2791028 RepID=UPI0018AF9BE0|nr:ThiF family adenylyltransferase [Pontibacter sp. 172403-2]MBF9255743.1 ThiF family adenylyltransferase [Pontibacter sp. 172403-2]
MLHSDSLQLYSGELSDDIKIGLGEIRDFFDLENVVVLTYDEDHIAIPVTYKVSLPPLGTVGGIDIRSEEPVLIKISLRRYPDQIPLILSDRKDFPKKHLAHLYVSRISEDPGKFCIVRNNPNEWFAGARMWDLLAVGEQWLFKAATGRLSDDGEEFDPIRLEGYNGYHVYKYDLLHDVVSNDQRFLPELGMALLFSNILSDEEEKYGALTYKTLSFVPFIQLANFIKVIDELHKRTDGKTVSPLLSILVWREDDEVEEEYCTSLPKNYGELRLYFNIRGIDIDGVLAIYQNFGLQKRRGIPIIHAIKRPKKMVGYGGHYEFINFSVLTPEGKGQTIPEDAKVLNLSHLEPFSSILAAKLSGETRSAKTLYIGAGSLGSKIIIHDARSGKMHIGVVDEDKFLQHNLARHALYHDKVGLNKADAIIKQISDMFETDSTKGLRAYAMSVEDVKDNVFEDYEWLVDSSASLLVQNWLSKKVLPATLKVSRCEIADDGRLGLLYIEGEKRNPRIDDLINMAYYSAIVNDALKSWRRRDSQRVYSTIDVGLGCSSTTTVMPDDIISLHSSVFSRLLHQEQSNPSIGSKGLIYLSQMEIEGIPKLRSDSITVSAFESYFCIEGSGWEVRMAASISARLLNLCKQNGKIETGGVLVGMANYKTKTIHVFDIIEEPQDSIGTCTGFLRGVKGLPECINVIKESTGGVVGYIGEWHTHPMNLEGLSNRDKATIGELVILNRKEPIPTCAIIVTGSKILPFVFL